MSVTITPAPSPNGTNHERLYLVRASSLGKPMALDAALKRGRSGIAIDTPRRGRDSMLGEHDDPHMQLEKLLGEHLQGEPFEQCQRLLDRIVEARETERQDDGEVIDEREDDEEEPERDHDEDERQREKRRRAMQAFAANARDNWNWDESQIREELENGFPKNGLEHLGGQLSEDVETVMQKHLEGEGGTAMSTYEREPKVTDRKRSRMARDSFNEMFPDAARLDGMPIEAGIGSTEREQAKLAYDAAAADDDGSFDQFFPNARRIGIG